MAETADAIVVGGGVQGASLAFHLSGLGLRVLLLERSAIAAGATGRSSGFVRMHYDLEWDARLAAASYPYFTEWPDRVGAGNCDFVRTGFVQLVRPEQEAALRANVAMLQRIGVDTCIVGPAELATIVEGMVTDDVVAAAWEPGSGYADPSATTQGFLAAARTRGARTIPGVSVERVLTDGDRVTGVATSRGEFAAPIVVDVAGAWAPALAATVGVDVPVVPWRHDTAFFALPEGRSSAFPIVIDNTNEVYVRPEGHNLMLVGLEIENVVGGDPARPDEPVRHAAIELMASRLQIRFPWMAEGTFRTAFIGQDGITPDERPIIGPAGPDGFYLACGFSGTGFKTAPAVGAALAELIVEGKARFADIAPYGLERFAEGRPLVAEHPYGTFWR